MCRLFLPLSALLLNACHDERPPAPTKDERARLDKADAMLNEAARTESAR